MGAEKSAAMGFSLSVLLLRVVGVIVLVSATQNIKERTKEESWKLSYGWIPMECVEQVAPLISAIFLQLRDLLTSNPLLPLFQMMQLFIFVDNNESTVRRLK